MNQPRNIFKQEFIDLQIEMAWRQWSALGVNANTPPERKRVIDPEALLAYTLSIGPNDRRLLEATLEWINEHSGWLSVSRLKAVLSLFCRPDAPLNEGIIAPEILAVFKEVIASQGPRWRSIVSFVHKQIEASGSNVTIKGFKPRGVLGALSFQQPVLAELQLRAIFGVEARASVFVFLLFNDEGNSNSIAKAIFADQGNVYKILEKWVSAGIIVKASGYKAATYSLAEKTRWLNLLGLDKELLFLNWMHTFHVLGKISTALSKQLWASDNYLMASFFRDVLSDLQPLAKQLKVGLPEPALSPGDKFFEPFSRLLIRLVNELIESK